jgi:hypothetical protein
MKRFLWFEWLKKTTWEPQSFCCAQQKVVTVIHRVCCGVLRKHTHAWLLIDLCLPLEYAIKVTWGVPRPHCVRKENFEASRRRNIEEATQIILRSVCWSVALKFADTAGKGFRLQRTKRRSLNVYCVCWLRCHFDEWLINCITHHSFNLVRSYKGRAIAQAVSRRVRSQLMWDLWWTKWYWDRFSTTTSVFPTSFHSTDWSILIYHPGLVQ